MVAQFGVQKSELVSMIYRLTAAAEDGANCAIPGGDYDKLSRLYRLQILADGIQDDSSNVTRFVMLARESIIPLTDRPFKTSIVFAHEKGTSVLFKVLSAFTFKNISLTKIESRPHRNRLIRLVNDANVGTAKHFEYMFYVDFEASMAEVRAQNALAEVQEFTSFLRVLGSYPLDMTPWCPSRGD
ncbi:arogenate dehydratase 3-like [Cornus florida]|uniref:arogenate dehydratase 3-like n=1 Tax=Cornus florida TaxID=4283 RepID=UPI00289B5955|nr:arogenate dehydratase 3-like [Cornus florida]